MQPSCPIMEPMFFARLPLELTGSLPVSSKTVDLLWVLVQREIRRERRRTLLGSGWFLLHPFLWLAAYSFVFTRLIPMGIADYPGFLLAGLLPWTLFTSGLCQAMGALQLHRPLFRVMIVTPWVFPVAAVLAGAPRLLVAMGVLLAWQAAGGALSPGALPWLLLLAAVQLLLTTGLGVLAAFAASLIADAQEAAALLLRVGFFFTPILYPLEKVPADWILLAQLNPITGLVGAYRQVLLEGEAPSLERLAPAAAMGILSLVLAVRASARLRNRLAESA